MKGNRKVISFIITVLPVMALLGAAFLIMVESGKSSEEILSAIYNFKLPLG